MLDFNKELDKLLAGEPELSDGLSDAVENSRRLLESLNKAQSDISLQVEEIYDLVSENDALKEAYRAEKARVDKLLRAAVGLADIVEDFYAFACKNGGELQTQARMMWKNSGDLLEKSGVSRLGTEGEPLNPELHDVRAASRSSYPREHAAEVLRSGYRWGGTVLRKAAIIVSTGEEHVNE